MTDMINVNGRVIEATGKDSKFEQALKIELKEHLKRYMPYIVRAAIMNHDTELDIFKDEAWALQVCMSMLEEIDF